MSRNPQGMRRSGIRMIMDLSAEVPDAIHLEVGQPDFDTPAHIVEAGCRAAKEGFTRYTPNAGLLSLREAIVEKLRERNGIEATVDQVVVTPGAVTAIATALLAIAEPGEEVLLPDPAWPNYEMMALSIGAVPVRYPLDPERGFLPDFEGMERAISERTKALMVNSPCNPTGAVFPEDVVRGLVEFTERHDLYLISDEVYEDIVFEGEHISPARFDRDGRVVSVFGFSKTYAMTGWRLGYAVASEAVARVVAKLQEPFVSCASAISQKAGEAALRGDQSCVAEMREAYRRRRDLAVGLFREYEVAVHEPKGAFYMLVDVASSGLDSYTFARRLLEEEKVAVAPGATFGPRGEGYVRISLATAEEQLLEGVRRLCRFLGQVKV